MFEVEVYEDARGEWRWRLVAENGRIVADSAEGYARSDGARAGFQRVHDALVKGELRWSV